MNKLRTTSIVLLAAVLIFAGSNLVFAQTEERNVSGFDEISYSLPGKLIIEQGNTESLRIKADKDDLEKIITKVEGDHLRIYAKNGNYHMNDVEIFVTVKELEAISLAGSGDVIVKGDLKTEELKVSLSGSGDVTVASLTAEEVDASLAGSGDIRLGGKLSSELEISIAGSGDVDASELQVQEADVSIAGSGNVKVWVEEDLDVSIVGSGNVYYKGRPIIDASSTGSGSTRPI